MDTPGKRLKWARENRSPYKKAATNAAEAFGWKVPTYLGHENGDRNPSRAKAKQYARAYKVPWEWILEGPPGPPPARSSEPNVPLVKGLIGAGPEVEMSDDLNDPIELPPASAIGVTVRGNSMYPRYMDGEKLLYLPEHRPAHEMVGLECAVKIKDGGMMVKIIRRGSRKNRFNLESWNSPTIEDVQIEWASPIRWRAP